MKTKEELLELAKQASANAYSPYSKFRVGACAFYESGNYYLGCNVENASYGLSLCAERNAVSNAIVAGEKSKLLTIAIYSPDTTFCAPCGACRQWMWEFEKGQSTKIILENEDYTPIEYSVEELLPHNFKLINLNQ